MFSTRRQPELYTTGGLTLHDCPMSQACTLAHFTGVWATKTQHQRRPGFYQAGVRSLLHTPLQSHLKEFTKMLHHDGKHKASAIRIKRASRKG
jgi:hypothetical protein